MNELMLLFPFVLTLLYSLATVPILVWMERRIAALIQHRIGPNRCNIKGIRLGGIIQSVADMMKLVFKEELLAKHIKNRLYYTIAPAIVFMASFLTFMVIPYADNVTLNAQRYSIQALPTDLGILWFLAFAGLSVYGIILGGWSSHSKYAILGSLRASAQVISYEVAMTLSLVSMLLTYASTNLNDMVIYQSQTFFGFIPAWGIVLQPVATIIFIITAFAETNRAPFDAAEGESEIVAGYHTEYGAMKFGLFFVAEYIAMAASGALIVTIFLGGYQLPFMSTADLINNFHSVVGGIIISFSLLSYYFVRWIKRNNSYSDASRLESSYYIKVIYFAVPLFIIFLIASFFMEVNREIGVMLIQIAIFTTKLFMLHFVFIWVRWTLPRFRYDQTQYLGWNILLPIALINIIITAIVIVGVNYGH